MKAIHLIGSKDKSSLAFYLSKIAECNGYKSLVVDNTFYNRYKDSYFSDNASDISSIDGVDVLLSVNNKDSLDEKIVSNLIDIYAYDIIIVDSDTADGVSEKWFDFYDSYYISDNNMENIVRDVDIIHRYWDENDLDLLKRIHFKSEYAVKDNIILLMTNYRREFSPFSEYIEYDNLDEYLKYFIQHTGFIPESKINKDYRRAINNMLIDVLSIEDNSFISKIKNFFSFKFNKSDVGEEV